MTLFTTENGACHLTVVIAEQPDMDGMAGHTASRVKVTVQPGTPARVETAEGKALVFICEPGANSMKVELPPDFKFSPKVSATISRTVGKRARRRYQRRRS